MIVILGRDDHDRPTARRVLPTAGGHAAVALGGPGVGSPDPGGYVTLALGGPGAGAATRPWPWAGGGRVRGVRAAGDRRDRR